MHKHNAIFNKTETKIVTILTKCFSSYLNPTSYLNDTHRERLVVFHSIQYRNGWLAASDLFHMFTKLIKFYTFYYQYRCLKNVIHQIYSKNGWLLLSASLQPKFLVSFCLNTGRLFFWEVSFSSQQKEHRFF